MIYSGASPLALEIHLILMYQRSRCLKGTTFDIPFLIIIRDRNLDIAPYSLREVSRVLYPAHDHAETALFSSAYELSAQAELMR